MTASTQSTGEPLIRHAMRDGVAIVTLNRPPQNRLTRTLYAELEAAIRHGVRAGARAMLFRSELDDFCLGGDFREWPHLETHSARRERFGYSNGILNAIESLPIPTICEVNGRAYGGGFELALACDIRIASQTARFGLPEPTLGLIAGGGGIPRRAGALPGNKEAGLRRGAGCAAALESPARQRRRCAPA